MYVATKGIFWIHPSRLFSKASSPNIFLALSTDSFISQRSKVHTTLSSMHNKYLFLDNCRLSQFYFGDLREQISRRPSWKSYSKGFSIRFATSGSRVWPVTFMILSMLFFDRAPFRYVARDYILFWNS